LNRLIQSSAADQTKAAMAAVHDELGVVPLVQIHDELAFSVESEADARKIRAVMESAVRLEVPTPADIAMGETWGTIKEVVDE